jgi:AraC-like DNA-binding protein
MRTFGFESIGERPAIPQETNFVQNWEVLARTSGYRRHRLAKLVKVSTRTLDRHFEKHLSLSVQQWLSELRMAVAYDQVMTGKPLKEISFDVGFKQPSHFTKRFKARFGIPPSLLLGSRPLVPAKSLCRACVGPPTADPGESQNDHAASCYAE